MRTKVLSLFLVFHGLAYGAAEAPRASLPNSVEKPTDVLTSINAISGDKILKTKTDAYASKGYKIGGVDFVDAQNNGFDQRYEVSLSRLDPKTNITEVRCITIEFYSADRPATVNVKDTGICIIH